MESPGAGRGKAVEEDVNPVAVRSIQASLVSLGCVTCSQAVSFRMGACGSVFAVPTMRVEQVERATVLLPWASLQPAAEVEDRQREPGNWWVYLVPVGVIGMGVWAAFKPAKPVIVSAMALAMPRPVEEVFERPVVDVSYLPRELGGSPDGKMAYLLKDGQVFERWCDTTPPQLIYRPAEVMEAETMELGPNGWWKRGNAEGGVIAEVGPRNERRKDVI